MTLIDLSCEFMLSYLKLLKYEVIKFFVVLFDCSIFASNCMPLQARQFRVLQAIVEFELL